MTTPDAVIALLEAWLAEGVHEIPDGSNRTNIGEEFGWNGVAWCAETCSVAMKRAGQPGFWTASVAAAIADAKNGHNGLVRLGKTDMIRRGDFVTFDWKGNGNPSDFHIATVVDPHDQHTFQTIGGNENNAVTKQWRDRTYVSGFIRPAYDAPTPPPPPEEDDMPTYVIHTPKGGFLSDGLTVKRGIGSQDEEKRWIAAGAKEITLSEVEADRIPTAK